MVNFSKTDIKNLDRIFAMREGYVLDFSNKTFAEFMDDELQVDIYADQYSAVGTSKAKRLREFWRIESAELCASSLLKLWSYRETLGGEFAAKDAVTEARNKSEIDALIAKISDGVIADLGSTFTTHTSQKQVSITELVAAIERDFKVGDFPALMDRLHTYSDAKLGHLLDCQNIQYNRSTPLNGKLGLYCKHLESNGNLAQSVALLKRTVPLFEQLNEVRNNHSFAHPAQVLDHSSARYLFDMTTATLRHLKAIDRNFDA